MPDPTAVNVTVGLATPPEKVPHLDGAERAGSAGPAAVPGAGRECRLSSAPAPASRRVGPEGQAKLTFV
jgi:hypothetical protein